MAEFVTDASGATWWPNLEPMHVAFFLLAVEITQVKEAIPWVRCASGNVLKIVSKTIFLQTTKSHSEFTQFYPFPFYPSEVTYQC